jgi:hypothetical protein
MSNQRSSSRADAHASRARRSPWPWLLATGPALVVVASLASAWLAISRNDTLVADDYYKLGLSINRKLAATATVVPAPGATIVIAASGDVRVRLTQATPTPAHLRLTVVRPGERSGQHAVTLDRRDGVDFVGTLPDVAAGRRIVTLEGDTWRLPVTVIDHLPISIALGAVDSDS